MDFSAVFSGLKLSVVKFSKQYEAGRARRPELAPYATTTALLSALKLSSSLSYDDRDAITLALIAEQQSEAHPLWQTLLLAAFEPMLRRLRARVGGGDEIEQAIVVAFLDAIQKLALHHPPSHAALYLRRATERAVFAKLRVERARPEHVSIDEVEVPDPSAFAPDDHAEEIKSTDVMRLALDEASDPELVRMLMATSAGNERLCDYVETTYAALSKSERRTKYLCLQKRRHRLLSRVKALYTKQAATNAA